MVHSPSSLDRGFSCLPHTSSGALPVWQGALGRRRLWRSLHRECPSFSLWTQVSQLFQYLLLHFISPATIQRPWAWASDFWLAPNFSVFLDSCSRSQSAFTARVNFIPLQQKVCAHGEGSFSHWEYFMSFFYHPFLLWWNDMGLSNFSTRRFKKKYYQPKSFALKKLCRLLVKSI